MAWPAMVWEEGAFIAKTQKQRSPNGMLKFDIGLWAFDIKARYNGTF